MKRWSVGLALAFAITGCRAGADRSGPASSGAPVARASSSAAAALEAIAAVHGGSGPWVVAGYRMGQHALAVLGLPRGSFDLDVVHHTPRKVQFSCVADGAAAATGASLGKLDLTLVEADESEVRTTYTDKRSGRSLTLKPAATFVSRFRDVPRAELARQGEVVLGLSDAEIFEEVASPSPDSRGQAPRQ